MNVEPVVVAFDLSLKHTGVAHADGTTTTFVPDAGPEANGGMDRMDEIRGYLEAVVATTADLELVIIEGLAFDGHDRNREQAQLAGIVRHMLYSNRWPYLLVPPATMKKYATGNGRADKYEVVRAAERRLGYDGLSSDEADALWLRAIGWELLEMAVAEMPKVNRDALTALRRETPVLRPT